jgi:7,8-dihydro-6-hydroxymethylpterin dimethyltransferase
MSHGPRGRRSHVYLGQTTSTCPVCLALVPAKILRKDGKVFFDKLCPEHGPSMALVEEDADYFLRSIEYSQPGSIPHSFATPAARGCPHDCGLCPRHEQHCCHPIVEITNHCDLNCPICMANHGGTFHLSLADFRSCVDRLIEAEGSLENLTLSGGEPTLHPDLLSFVDMAARPEIARVSLVTNGLRIARDPAFCDELLKRGVYIILQYDGLDPATSALRGADLSEIKARALRNLEERKMPTQLLFVAARHVNENRLGDALDLLFGKPFILSLAVQPLTFATDREGQDPMDRLTTSGTILQLARQSRGVLRKEDFFPLPCPHPRCVSLTYLLGTDDGTWVPLPQFVDIKRYLSMLSESATLSPSAELESSLHEILSDLWSTSGECPQNERIVRALRSLLQKVSVPGRDAKARQKLTEASAKSIFIHHYMDRFNFDLARLPKCCHHYPQPDGRSVPICSYNLFHRAVV